MEDPQSDTPPSPETKASNTPRKLLCFGGTRCGNLRGGVLCCLCFNTITIDGIGSELLTKSLKIREV